MNVIASDEEECFDLITDDEDYPQYFSKLRKISPSALNMNWLVNKNQLLLVHFLPNMSEPRQKDPSDPLYDPCDKWNEYKVDLHCKESHGVSETDPDAEQKIAAWEKRHQDKVLDDFCDNHPGSPM